MAGKRTADVLLPQAGSDDNVCLWGRNSSVRHSGKTEAFDFAATRREKSATRCYPSGLTRLPETLIAFCPTLDILAPLTILLSPSLAGRPLRVLERQE